MEIINGGIPGRGEPVKVLGKHGERRATVIASAFESPVFRGDVSVRYLDDGTLDLVPRSAVERDPEGDRLASPAGPRLFRGEGDLPDGAGDGED